MKIVLLVHNLQAKDGWSRYACDLGRALAEHGHELHYLVATKTEQLPWCTQHRCLQPQLHSLNVLGTLRQLLQVRRALNAIDADVVHVITEPYAIVLACLQRHEKMIITLHGSYAVVPFRSGAWARYWWQRALRRASAIVTVSAFTKKFLQDNEPAFFSHARLEEKVVVIRNAMWIDDSIRTEPHDEHRTPKHIMGVGAVKERKGYLQVMRSLAAFKRRTNVALHYDLIGSLEDAVYVENVRKEIQALNLGREVQLRGTLPEKELREMYANADLFLMLSPGSGLYVEGFVLGFIEAAARGIPCIGPRTGGCPEAIAEGTSGYICDPDDAEAVAEAMENILVRHSIQREACRRWAEAHDIRTVVASFEVLYAPTPPRCS